jgi:hypothetical protein
MNTRVLRQIKANALQSVTTKLDGASAAEVKRLLEQFPLAVQDRVMRRALWNYNRMIAKTVKAQRPSRTGKLRRATSVKMKNYKGVMWGAVAGRTGLPKDRVIPPSGKARRAIYDMNAGWREHFTELGWHSWPSGDPRRGKGKGWKKGLFHRGRGTYHRGSLALLTAAQVFQPRLRSFLVESLTEAVGRYAVRKHTSPRTVFARV